MRVGARGAILGIFGTVLLGLSSWVAAQSAPPIRGTLELPASRSGSEPVEEPDDIITFYGGQYQSDEFYWCLDRSASLGWAGEIATLRAQTRQAIEQLSPDSKFSLVAFATTTQSWRPTAQEATPEAKANATQWVDDLVLAGGRCFTPAMQQILRIARGSTRQKRTVILVGAGLPSCGSESPASVLDAISIANPTDFPIHVVHIGASSPGSISFLQQVASQNDGTFTLIF